MYLEKPIKKCLTCGKVYKKNNKYSNTQWYSSKYCSKICLLKRPQEKVIKYKVCKQCNQKFIIDSKLSKKQREKLLYCSNKCAGEAKKINDGKTRYKRYATKNSFVKKYSPEWLEKIKSKTTEAMCKPEINFKLRQPREAMSIERKIKLSNALAGKLPKNMMFGSNSDTGCFANIQRGEYECSKGSVYFRSKWEANYALYLDFLMNKGEIIDWEFEVDVFVFDKIQFGTRSYRPDFKVFTNDGLFEYHEVKGYMDGKSKTKLKRMAKYYPEIKLILIDKDAYNSIKKQLGKMLNFY